MARSHFCNVLSFGRDSRRLWQFLAANRKFAVQKEETKLPGEALNSRIFAKDWEHLLQPRLNVAWVPPEEVFLRVLQLPKAEAEETRSMLDLQLEKLSPLPTAQVVWSYCPIPSSSAEMQTVIVIIVARHQVEHFLGELEKVDFFADRLELPFLDELQEMEQARTGVWIYAGWGSWHHACLAAWWQDGVLRNLSLIHLPADQDRASVFHGKLKQVAWTGELEGWLTSDPVYHLVAGPEIAEHWQSLFNQDQSVDLHSPLAPAEIAVRTARRVTADSAHTNLLPPEFTARYRQRFVDRLWMRGLAAAVAVYMIGVAIYFGWTEVAKWKLDRVNLQVANISLEYTNTLRLKEQVRVMRNQIALQFAALDCWRAVADHLPTELTLENFNFERGQRVTYIGLVPMDEVAKVQDFNDAMRNAKIGDQKIFKTVDPPKINPRPPNQMSWSFVCQLERSEVE